MNFQASKGGCPRLSKIIQFNSSHSLGGGYYERTTGLTPIGATGKKVRPGLTQGAQAAAGGRAMRMIARPLFGKGKDSLANHWANGVKYVRFNPHAGALLAGRFLYAPTSRASRVSSSTGSRPEVFIIPRHRMTTNMDVASARVSRLNNRDFLAPFSCATFRGFCCRASVRTYPLGTQSGAEGAEPID